MKEQIDNFVIKNYNDMVRIGKTVLKTRYMEGISLYYDKLYNDMKIPDNFRVHYYYFLKNINLSNGALNYVPKLLRITISDNFICENEYEGDSEYESYDVNISNLEPMDDLTNYEKIDMSMDVGNEEIVDFLINNTNSEKWIKIYKMIYLREVNLDLFEQILFEYIFIEGYSIRQITKITSTNNTWVYKYRKSLLDKLKKHIEE